ncbi:MarR family winged helix-turn-helix transcriptional regulator [Streptomyces sp. NPDC015131]|uniref:MarR family winged helix-turn-helix transcriptional regulator n=1 Tax=Streptomyces sp. NPDC015131 TaxID=3364941 RepID=UPI00370003C8
MSESRVGGSTDREAAAHAAREVVELLDVLWNRGRGPASAAPVSSAQLRVLYVLDRDSPVNLRALGDALGAAPSSVSRMCDRLAALGLIERSPSATSRRELELRLSGRGERHLRDVRARRESALLDVVSAMRPVQRSALAAGLSGLRGAIERTGGREGVAAVRFEAAPDR